MTQPLALDSAAVGEAAGWRRHEDLIDALPYVDTMSPEEKQKVDRMIQEEVCAPLSWWLQLPMHLSSMHCLHSKH